MAERRLLPDLRPQLPGLERRRRRRPAGHPLAAAVPAGARRRRALADAVLPLAAGRPRLRRRRLHRRRPAVRHARRLRRARRRRARARDQGDDRHRPEPHLRPARVVPERDRRPGAPRPEALHVPARHGTAARRTAGRPPSAARPGRSTSRPASTTSTSSRPSSPTSTGTTRPCRTSFDEILRFWLDRGVDGFRIDVAHALFKAQDLPRDGRAGAAAAVRRLALGADAARAAPALPPLAPDRRRVPRRPDVRRRDRDREPGDDRELRRAGPAAPLLQLRAPPRAVGRRADARDDRPRADDARRRRRARDLGLREPRRHPAADALRRRRARAAAGPRGGAAPLRPAGRGVHLPGPGARARGGRCPGRGAPGPDLPPHDGARKGRDGCRVPIPWTTEPPAFGFTDGEPWLPMPRGLGPAQRRGAGARSRTRRSRSSAPRSACGRAARPVRLAREPAGDDDLRPRRPDRASSTSTRPSSSCRTASSCWRASPASPRPCPRTPQPGCGKERHEDESRHLGVRQHGDPLQRGRLQARADRRVDGREGAHARSRGSAT